MRLFRSIATIPFLLLLSHLAGADDLQDALRLENTGQITSAITAYGRWVALHPDHEEAASTLIHAASLHENPLEAIMFLAEYAGKLQGRQSSRVYARMAGLESLIGLLSDAAEHYERAARIGGEESEAWLLEAAVLYLAMGEADKAWSIASELAEGAENQIAGDEAAAIAALATAGDGRPSEGLGWIEEYLAQRAPPVSPLPYLALERLGEALGNRSAQERARRGLEEHFGGSAALYLAERRILEWTAPAALLRERDSQPSGPVQVGAFRDRDGASALREELEKVGFVSWMESGDGFWRVFVNDPDGNVASRLAAEGYPILIPGR